MRPEFLDDIQHAPNGVTEQIRANLSQTWNSYQENAVKVGFMGFNVYTDEVLQKHKNAALQAAGKTEIDPVPQSIWQILWMQKHYEDGQHDESKVGTSDPILGGPKDSSGGTAWLPVSRGFDSSSLKEAFGKGRKRVMIQYDWYSSGKQAFIEDHGYQADKIRLAFWPPHETWTHTDKNARLINRIFLMGNNELATIVSYNSTTDQYTIRYTNSQSTSVVSSSLLTNNQALVYKTGDEFLSISLLFPNWEWVLKEGVYVGQYRLSPTDELSLFPKPVPSDSTIDALVQGKSVQVRIRFRRTVSLVS